MRRSALLLLAVASVLAGCGSSSNTTPKNSTPVAATGPTTATTTTPKHLSKKEIAEEHAAERAKRAQEAREEREREKGNEREVTENAANEAEQKAAENARKVVEVAKGESVSATEAEVESIKRHLISLSHKCEQDIPTLAAYINSGVKILAKSGIQRRPGEIAAELDKAAPGKKVTPECRGVLAGLLVLIEKG